VASLGLIAITIGVSEMPTPVQCGTDLTIQFAIDAFGVPQSLGRKVIHVMVDSKAIRAMQAWNVFNASVIEPHNSYRGTLWGANVHENFGGSSGIFRLIDNSGHVHDFLYHSTAAISSTPVKVLWEGEPFIYRMTNFTNLSATDPLQEPTAPQSTICPCGIFRIDCDYHR
jgi:hypothetical protein